MPKVILEFQLPEEESEFELARDAGKYLSALNDLYQFLRQDSKYGEGKFEEVYSKFWEIMSDRDIDPV